MRTPGTLARFRLLRELGRGAQAVVWLAHDPRLQREVALKLMSPAAPPDAGAVEEWLHEARAVSRLTHPHIVPVFEADEHAGQPYLVFEYVDGPTLAQARRHQPPMAAREAVTLMLGVLDALAAAHEGGLVHRDLKPSNILLGRDGRARVMDFGIAARITDGEGLIVGSPGYMSPEAARGEAAVPAMDVFAAGALLGELLAGRRLMQETDPFRALHRVQHEDLVLPPHGEVDAMLRGVVQRALARDQRMRYDSARALHAALANWLNPMPAQVAVVDSRGGHATLDFLLRRMRHKTDFPALSASVVRIQRVAQSETESLQSLTDEILTDVALTHKLLRMVNTAHFSAVGGGSISTVSRAVALIGFAGIRNMAMSVLLLEHMSDKGHAALLKGEFLRALMAGMLADELAPRSMQSRGGEEAFLGAMFQNLGRLLTEYYFPEEAMQIRQQLAVGEGHPGAREAAARRVLGIGLDELGAGVARAWGLPDTLQRALRTPEGDVPQRPFERGGEHAAERTIERMRWLGRGANALADALLSGEAQAQAQATGAVAELYAAVLGLSGRDIAAAVNVARGRLTQLSRAMGIEVSVSAQASRLLDTGAVADEPATLVIAASSSPATLLAQTLEKTRRAIADKSMKLPELLHLVLDAIHRAFDFRRVVFCLREPASGCLVGRIGLGAGAEDLCAAFRVTPDAAASGDLFAALSAKGADLLVADSRTVVRRLPAWYRQHVDAPTFLLLPVLHKGAAIGLIYADKARAGTIVLGEEELALLRALRDEGAAAFGR